MKNNNNDLIIHRNETFTMDRVIQNQDGSPYLISSKLNNPHLLITVSSNKYRQNNRYLKKFYLPIPCTSTFFITNPIFLSELSLSENGQGFTDFPSNLKLEKIGAKFVFMDAYYQGQLVSFEPNDAVFAKRQEDNTVEYKMWLPDSLTAESSGSWIDYEFRFVKTFDSDFTSQLVEQTYYYCIELVAGRVLLDYLKALCESNFITVEESDNVDTLYEKLVNKGINMNGIDPKDDVLFYDYVTPILEPHTISVLSNLKGGML